MLGSDGWGDFQETETDSSGNYALPQLLTGSYRVGFSDSGDSPEHPDGYYAPRYYHDALTVQSAGDVSVSTGVDTTGIDQALVEGASIDGTIQNAAHDPVGSQDAALFENDGGSWSRNGRAGFTDSAGHYHIGGLAAGSYRIGFGLSRETFVPQYWNAASTLDAGTSVVLSADTQATGISATLTSATVPANDAFASAQDLPGRSGSVTGANRRATLQTGETVPATIPVSRSVWYKWTAMHDGDVTFDTIGSDFDTVLGVWTGSDVTALSPVASDDDEGIAQTSRVTFRATKGVTYRVAVYGSDTEWGWIPWGRVVLNYEDSPITTSDAATSYNGTATIKLTASEAGGSSIAYTHYILDAGTETSSTVVKVDPPAFGTASHTLKFWSANTAGDVEATNTVTFVVGAQGTFKNVYRFRNLKSGFYLWSADENEKATIIKTLSKTWTYEGVAYQIDMANPLNTSPLWRFVNIKGGYYLYSADPTEKASIIAKLSKTWHFEGQAYTVSTNSSGAPVWRFRNLKNGTYLYSADPAEKASIIQHLATTWQLEGPAYYLAP